MFEMNLVHFMDCNNDLDVILKSVGKGDLFMREKRFLLKDEETGDLVCEKYCGKDCPVIFDNPVYNEVVVGGQMRKYLEDYPLYLTEDEEGFYDFNADLDYRTGADEETGESIIDNTDRIPDYSPVYDNDEIAEAERVRAEAEKKMYVAFEQCRN